MNYTKREEDGFIIEVWESACRDCKFVTGLAQVTRPDGTKRTMSGAGCFQRRDRKAVEQWVNAVIQESSPESLDT